MTPTEESLAWARIYVALWTKRYEQGDGAELYAGDMPVRFAEPSIVSVPLWGNDGRRIVRKESNADGNEVLIYSWVEQTVLSQVIVEPVVYLRDAIKVLEECRNGINVSRNLAALGWPSGFYDDDWYAARGREKAAAIVALRAALTERADTLAAQATASLEARTALPATPAQTAF